MPQVVRHHVHPGTRITWVLPILTGLLIGCLLAFVANLFMREARLASNAAGSAFEASAAPESKPAPEFKKPARYEAVKSNWAKHRSESLPKD